MDIYIRLIGIALIPAGITVVLYVLKSRNVFAKVPYGWEQVIYGVIFGIAAILGTVLGVEVNGAIANARDAAPLCAGMFFGLPAGILAGIIGGAYRWFAVYWGAGTFTRLACSLATVLSGIFAGLLRKNFFDDKRVPWNFAVVLAVVMEVIHMTLVFFTHFHEIQDAFAVVEAVCLPMIIANAVAVLLAALPIEIMERNNGEVTKRRLTISEKLQEWMLLAVVVAYFVTTSFVYILQTTTAKCDAESIMQVGISGLEADINNTADENMLKINRDIADELDENPNSILFLTKYINQYQISEVNIVDENGIITSSTVKKYVGFDMSSGAQSAEFLCLLNGETEYVQNFQNISFDDEDDSKARKYSGVALKDGGFVQIGYELSKFQTKLSSEIKGVSQNRALGQTGYIITTDTNQKIVSSGAGQFGVPISHIGIDINSAEPMTMFEATVSGTDCECMYDEAAGFVIVAVMPEEEIFADRDMSLYVNSFMEVIAFALLFVIIFLVIKYVIVSDIRKINTGLGKVIGGDLDEVIDVKSTEEFETLSGYINTTIEALKEFIHEAETRMQKDLDMAKNIQLSALPSVFPAYPNVPQFDVCAFMDPAKEVGGDFYDFYMLGEDKLVFLVADVSGKGVPAALFMMRAKTLIKAAMESGMAVNDAFTQANEALCEGNDAGMFVTGWMGILDIHTGHVDFANAGHNPPLIYRKGQGYEYLNSKKGFVLAGMEGVIYKRQEFDLNPGDRVFLYTDGVTEATSADIELFGEPRLHEVLNTNPEDHCGDTIVKTMHAIDAFVGEAEQFDDITMVSVYFAGDEAEPQKSEKVALEISAPAPMKYGKKA